MEAEPELCAAHSRKLPGVRLLCERLTPDTLPRFWQALEDVPPLEALELLVERFAEERRLT